LRLFYTFGTLPVAQAGLADGPPSNANATIIISLLILVNFHPI